MCQLIAGRIWPYKEKFLRHQVLKASHDPIPAAVGFASRDDDNCVHRSQGSKGEHSSRNDTPRALHQKVSLSAWKTGQPIPLPCSTFTDPFCMEAGWQAGIEPWGGHSLTPELLVFPWGPSPRPYSTRYFSSACWPVPPESTAGFRHKDAAMSLVREKFLWVFRIAFHPHCSVLPGRPSKHSPSITA